MKGSSGNIQVKRAGDRIEILIVRGNARWTQVTPQVARQVAIGLDGPCRGHRTS